MSEIESVTARLTDVMQSASAERGIAGAVVGVAIGDELIEISHGTANLNTDQAFTRSTGWLLGSVTKVLVTTALLRLVERGAVDLGAPVRRYVPEFTLRNPDAAEQITVRMLLNHSSGIDADVLGPSAVRGRDACRSYTEALADMDVLFEPGTFLHYSNPGFALAARILEEHTGLPFERAIEQEVLQPCGMVDSTAVQTQAFLRRTAVGASVDPETGKLRATRVFTLPESLAGAGATMIVTVQDMLAFGRMHLRGGVAATGERVLSRESVDAMQTPTNDIGIPQTPPVGLGWWLVPIAGTTARWHPGGSPGGLSSFSVLPDHDAVIVSFVSGVAGGESVAGGGPLNDQVHNAVLEELTGRAVTPPFSLAPSPPDDDIVGEYASFQHRMHVDRDGEGLVVSSAFEPYDEDHARVWVDGYGYETTPEALSYASVSPGLYARAGVEAGALGGLYGRVTGLLSTVPAVDGRPAGVHALFRYTPKVG